MAENGVEENGLLPAEKKRLKTTSSSSSEDVVDRISKLSDELILHILLVLPTVDAVSTSFLSDRWKRMWYLVPNLSFSITASRYNSSQDQEKFCNYIHNCLEHRKKAMFYNRSSVITSFKLQMDCYERTKNHYLDKWLTFAVEKKV
ncbi:putative F-box/LRR-repeat protein At4g15060 [Cannabis sativa]|uniref:putative F-box/LRR-repeat protein At4g15060 n=1 Tax=Cannabis sativa TaxID=3483 RepID=UPI0029CAA938|nr:putative F-box/LRR-repeat protein At4g15060 [Cannabis sativa]